MVNTVLKSIEILDALGHESLRASEISKRLSMPKSSVHNILQTLEHHGLVERNRESNTYHLGIKLVELGNLAQKDLDITRVAKQSLKRLNQETDETVHLTILDDYEVLYVDCVESTRRLRTYSVIGVRAPLHCTSVGKAMLAWLSDDEVEYVIREKGLPRFTQNTITSPDALREELARIREEGYAIDNMEHEDHVRCVGAPIRDASGSVFSSISLSGPAQRVSRGNLPVLSEHVVRTAAEISKRLGYSARASEPLAEVSSATN